MNKVYQFCLFYWCLLPLQSQPVYHKIDFQHPRLGQAMLIPVYFDLDKYWIRPDACKVLDSLVTRLCLIDSFTFTIESYTDCRASAMYNKYQCERKADSIVAYMRRRSGNRLHLTALGFGEDSLLNGCACENAIKIPCSEAQHQVNRRTVLRITGIRRD